MSKRWMKRSSILVVTGLSSGVLASGGFTTAAIPTKIDIIGSSGFVMFGAFSNPGGCSVANVLFVRSEHPQYRALYATALAAYTSKQKVSAYVHACEPIPWYSVPSVTYNTVTMNGTLAIGD
jgi:hypothetical protein